MNPNATNMDEEKSYVFHTTISKEFLICKRSKPDIQPTVPFLYTIVKGLDEQDWKRLLRMIKYLQET